MNEVFAWIGTIFVFGVFGVCAVLLLIDFMENPPQ